MKRREARELAFAILFEKTFKGDSVQEIIDNATESRDLVVDDYVITTCSNIEQNQKSIDEKISANLTGWKLNRLSKITASVLRLAFYEILYNDEVPYKVTINECVEIAKKYEGDQAGSFVNGVLGSLIKSLEK